MRKWTKKHTFVNGTTIPQRPDEQRDNCEGGISKAETVQALKLIKSGSVPGIDGIIVGFLTGFGHT